MRKYAIAKHTPSRRLWLHKKGSETSPHYQWGGEKAVRLFSRLEARRHAKYLSSVALEGERVAIYQLTLLTKDGSVVNRVWTFVRWISEWRP